jgi:diguanylate cyclase (GGDEF)-like protein
MVKVLVVDDDSHYRGIIERIILRSYTYSVTSVASEEEAWEDLAKDAYDLVILDLYIDGRKSWDTLKRIRAMPSAPVVIMISCEDLAVNAEHAKALGAADFIAKPIDFGALKSSVDAALEGRMEDRFGRRAGDAAGGDRDSEGIGLLLLSDHESRPDTAGELQSPRFRLFETEDPGWAAEMVRKEKLDAVLARMGGEAGPFSRLIALLGEEDPGHLRVPVIAITEDDPDRILCALKAGADDYVTLPFDPRILAAKIEAHVRFRREHERSLQEGASGIGAEPIAGLSPSAHFRARLEEEVYRSLRHRRDLALAVLKVVGKPAAFGPKAQQRILTEASRVLRTALRRSDVLGRWTKDDIAFILPEATADRILRRAGAICRRVEEKVSELSAGRVEIRCHMGLASLPPPSSVGGSPGAERSIEEFLGMASAALCRARRSGERRVEIFADDRFS